MNSIGIINIKYYIEKSNIINSIDALKVGQKPQKVFPEALLAPGRGCFQAFLAWNRLNDPTRAKAALCRISLELALVLEETSKFLTIESQKNCKE